MNNVCGLQVQSSIRTPAFPPGCYMLSAHRTDRAAMLLSACLSSPTRQNSFHLLNNGVGKNTVIHFSINVFMLLFLFITQKSRAKQSKQFSGNELVKSKLCEIYSNSCGTIFWVHGPTANFSLILAQETGAVLLNSETQSQDCLSLEASDYAG